MQYINNKANFIIGILILLILGISISASAQELTQTVKGKVIDEQVQFSLPGASVVVVGTDPLIGTVTDEAGNFVLQNVPVGRIDLVVSFIGYEEFTLTDILVV